MSDQRPDDPNEKGPDNPNENRTDYRYRSERERRREIRERDPLRGLFPGLLLIVLGVLFLAATRDWITWDIWWRYLLIGLGAAFLIDAAAHYLNPNYRDTAFGRFIPGVILLFIGLAFLYGFDLWWPLVLIAAGIVILLSFLFRRK